MTPERWGPRPGSEAGTRSNGDDERGSTLLLTIFLSFLALVIVLMVVAASSLYLERKRLFTLADGAALAGAEAWELDDVAVDGDALAVDLDDQAVRAAAAAYLADAGGRLDGVELVSASSHDGRSATVTLRAEWRAPVHTELLPVVVPIEVTTTARSVFH